MQIETCSDSRVHLLGLEIDVYALSAEEVLMFKIFLFLKIFTMCFKIVATFMCLVIGRQVKHVGPKCSN